MTRQDGIDALPVESAVPERTSLRINIVANFAGRAYSLGANYLFIPFYIRILGVEAYGLIAFYAVLLAVSSILDIGLSATFSRQAAKESDPGALSDILGTAERMLIAGVSAFALAVFFAADWLATHWLQASAALPASEMVWPLRLMAAMLAPQMLVTLYSAGLLGLQRQVAANVIQASLITVRAGLVIGIIRWQPDLSLFFGWQFAATAIFAIVARATLLQRMGLRKADALRFRSSSLRPHLVYAGGLIAITIISTVNTQLDKLLISRLFPISDFGYYSIASTLAQIPLAVAMPIGVAFFPRLVASVANHDRGLPSIYGDFVRWVALVGGIGALGLALFADEILRLWLQAAVPAVVPQLTATLAIGCLLLCMNTPAYYLCLARGRSWLVVAVSLATLALSVPTLLIGLRLYGLWGGALVWVMLNLVNLILLGAAVQLASLSPPFAKVWRDAFAYVSIAALALVAARLIANAAGLGPLAACAVAGTASLAAVGALVLLDRSRARDELRAE